jgi:CRISPR type I-D-associated protein Csc1
MIFSHFFFLSRSRGVKIITFPINTVAVAAITFEDFVYFNSREENRIKEMLPVLHNVALQYAFKNASSRYRIHELVPDYTGDIARALHPYYIYPAMPVSTMKTTMFPIGWQSDSYRTFSSQTSTNLLQYATVKVATPENVFKTFVTSSLTFERLESAIPRIARLGKLSSKVAIQLEQARFSIKETGGKVDWTINPLDLPPGLKIGRDYTGSLQRMNPSDLLHGVSFKTPVPVIDAYHDNHAISLPVCHHFQGMIQR